MDDLLIADPIATVHVEACVAFVADPEAPDGICGACGWLLDDHLAEPARAA